MPRSICCALCLIAGLARPLVAADLDDSLELLAWTAMVYTEQRDCFSCHHQTLPALALKQAQRQGLTVDTDEIRNQVEFTHRFFEQRKDAIRDGKSVPGGPFTAGYALVLLADNDWPADDTTAALVAYLRQQQHKDGSWWIRPSRPPMEESQFTSTALSLRGLQLYDAPANDADRPAHQERIDRARRWLESAPVQTLEDRAFRLLGLDWAGADRDRIHTFADELIANQREDGGWSQTADLDSDAYATGQALVALRETAAIDTRHPAFRRGITFLERTRLDDGSWFVAKRCRPVQKYFESGFPHDEAQFISVAATAWATRALLYDAASAPNDHANSRPAPPPLPE